MSQSKGRSKGKSKGGKSADADDRYEGETNAQGKRDGRGTCKFATGDTYEGEWKDGRMHGKGR